MPRRPAPLTVRQITLTQAAELLQVHPNTVRRMVSRGQLRAYYIGRHIRIDPVDLAALRQPVTKISA